MTQPITRSRRIAIIGGGISGLAAAYRLQELNPEIEVTLLESRNRLGGAIQTTEQDQFLVEAGPDMFTTKDPAALALCQRLGCESELIETNSSYRRAFVVRGKRLCPVPAGFTLLSPGQLLPLVCTRLLSPLGKLRALREYWVSPRHEESDESLADFTRRRLGNEVFERIVQPLVGGIYTADPEKLSMQATLSQFVEMERVHGGLIRGARQGRQQAVQSTPSESGARYGMFLTLRSGLSTLVDQLERQLGTAITHCATAVTRVVKIAEDGWKLELSEANKDPSLAGPYDGVILATPMHVAAKLLSGVDGSLASDMDEIKAASSAVVISGYRRAEIAHPLNGFGFVVPAREKRSILAASFSSIKFDGRAPQGHVLVRSFVGGAMQPDLLLKPDAELQSMVHREMEVLIGAQGKPCLNQVIRWNQAMPQYHVGHLQRVEKIETGLCQHPGLELAGSGLRGVGIPQCVRSGEEAAERIVVGFEETAPGSL